MPIQLNELNEVQIVEISDDFLEQSCELMSPVMVATSTGGNGCPHGC
jgi:hypothetical protein